MEQRCCWYSVKKREKCKYFRYFYQKKVINCREKYNYKSCDENTYSLKKSSPNKMSKNKTTPIPTLIAYPTV